VPLVCLDISGCVGYARVPDCGFTFKIESEAQFEQFLLAVGESNT
jgi:hypothetical protein